MRRIPLIVTRSMSGFLQRFAIYILGGSRIFDKRVSARLQAYRGLGTVPSDLQSDQVWGS